MKEIHWPGWCLSVAAPKSDVGIKKMILLSRSISLPPPKAYFNQVITSAVVAGNGAITDRPQGTAYQNWRLNFHKQKDHSCSLKPVTALSTKSNLTRNTRWEPGSLWPQLWSESESSSSSCRAWINRANLSFPTEKIIDPNSRACFVVCQLYSPLESKLSCQALALEPAPSIKIWCILDGKQAVKVGGTSAKNSKTLLSSCWFWTVGLIYILF